VSYLQTHDQVGNRAFGERLAALLPPEAGLLPTLLVLLTPAVPLLFFGEEWGATEPFLYFADWQGELREAVRAGRQREFGHVQGPQGQPLPDACSEATFAASRPDRARAATEAGRAWQEAVRAALAARRQWIIPRQHLLLPGIEHTVQRVGATGLAVQWRYDDGCELALELNLGPQPVAASPQRIGPVEAGLVYSHRRGADDAAWPAWSARWTLGQEITL
jgi:1,4-alpha-glucan branching enzyme/maltooligosyltrehalose trehalohydrolase